MFITFDIFLKSYQLLLIYKGERMKPSRKISKKRVRKSNSNYSWGDSFSQSIKEASNQEDSHSPFFSSSKIKQNEKDQGGSFMAYSINKINRFESQPLLLVRKVDLQKEEDKSNKKQSKMKAKYLLKHECSCHWDERQCKNFHCQCFLTQNEICVIGECCPECVQNKNNYFKTVKGWSMIPQKIIQPKETVIKVLDTIRKSNCKNMYYFRRVYPKLSWLRKLVFCTCKKSQCQKNYCICFQQGGRCGEFCTCEDCLNKEGPEELMEKSLKQLWQQYMKNNHKEQVQQLIQDDIAQFLEDDFCQEEFNQSMEFQPPCFDDVGVDM